MFMSQNLKNLPTKLSPKLLTYNQHKAVERIFEHDHTMLIAKMGAGKTVIALTAIAELMADTDMKRFVIFAPLKVAKHVWQQEAAKWEHTAGVNVALCVGTPAQREQAVKQAQGVGGILVVNFDNMAWFFDTFKRNHGFDGLLIDELSKLKAGGKGFKKMRPYIDSFQWRVGMTGTPCSEDFIGLFYQVMALDGGARFGKNRKHFLLSYFYPTDYNEYNWDLQDGGAERITAKLTGLVYTVPDYTHELPKLHHLPVKVFLKDYFTTEYAKLQRTHVLDTLHGVQSADNAAVLSGKLEQMASGFLYCVDDFGERLGTVYFHNDKIKVCKELVAFLNRNVIICYWFEEELRRLKEAFPDAVELNEVGAMEAWQRGEIKTLLLQPMSASHGIQLEQGGNTMIYIKPIWSNDIKSQCDARIWRKGQTKEVTIYEIVAVDTVDEMIVDRVNGKKAFDKLFARLT